MVIDFFFFFFLLNLVEFLRVVMTESNVSFSIPVTNFKKSCIFMNFFFYFGVYGSMIFVEFW